MTREYELRFEVNDYDLLIKKSKNKCYIHLI